MILIVDVYVETLKVRFRRVYSHKDVQKCFFTMTMRGHTQVCIPEEAIKKLQWTVLPHPPYSPDLAPTYYHLFCPLRDAIRGKKFEDDEEAISKVRSWLRQRRAEWYRESHTGSHMAVA
jgi:hypothetical protein